MRRLFGAVGALLVAAATVAVPQAGAQLSTDYSTVLAPLNGSGASGNVTIEVDGTSVTARVETSGVSPSLPHAQHIHIGGRNVCPPASAATQSPPRDLIDTVEGMPFYGGIKVSLTTEGDVTADSGLAVDRFPVATAAGTYVYERTFELPAGVTATDLVDGVVVVHGISELFADPAAYDGEPRSSIAPMLPLEATIPALCGELVEGPVSDPGEARDIADACPDELTAGSVFSDVDEDDAHAKEISCIAAYGITEGTTATTYSPGRAVPRDQMASFIVRLIEAADPGALEAESDGGDDFPCASNPGDLTSANVHFEAIQLLAAAGIVVGGPGSLPSDCYGPELAVTRAQMTSFINRAEEFLGHEISTSDNFFVDDEDSVHEDNINAVASEGIAVGLGNGRFAPGDDIRRDQMASFLARKLDYLVEQGDLEVPEAVVS